MRTEHEVEMSGGHAVRRGQLVRDTILLFGRANGGDLHLDAGDEVVIVVFDGKTRKAEEESAKRLGTRPAKKKAKRPAR